MNELITTDKFSVPDEIVDISSKVEGIEILAEALIVDASSKFSAGASLLGEIKTNRTGVKEALKDQKTEAHKKHKQYCDLESKYTYPLNHAEDILKSKMGEWAEVQKIKEEEARSDGINLPSLIPDTENISIRENWKCRIDDATKIPKEFLTVDIKKLNAHAKSTRGAVPVEGVEFFKSLTIVNG